MFFFFFQTFDLAGVPGRPGLSGGIGNGLNKTQSHAKGIVSTFKAVGENKIRLKVLFQGFFCPQRQKVSHKTLVFLLLTDTKGGNSIDGLSRPASSLPCIFNISPKNIPGTVLDAGGISEMLLCCMPKC